MNLRTAQKSDVAATAIVKVKHGRRRDVRVCVVCRPEQQAAARAPACREHGCVMSHRARHTSVKHRWKGGSCQQVDMDRCEPIMPTSVDRVMSATTGLSAV